MTEVYWKERSVNEIISNDPELAADLRLALSSAEEAATFIRQMRTGAGLSQQELALRLGISQPRVSTMEKGIGPDGPTCGMVRRIAQACGVNWSLEGGLREQQTPGEHNESGRGAMVAGAFGFIAGAVGMALLQTRRPNERVAAAAVEDPGGLPPNEDEVVGTELQRTRERAY